MNTEVESVVDLSDEIASLFRERSRVPTSPKPCYGLAEERGDEFVKRFSARVDTKSTN